MAPLKSSSIPNPNLRSRRTQLIFISALPIFTLLFFLNYFPLTPSFYSFHDISAATLSYSNFISPLSFQNGSGLVLAAQKITPPPESGWGLETHFAKKKIAPVSTGSSNRRENGSALGLAHKMMMKVAPVSSRTNQSEHGSGWVTQHAKERDYNCTIEFMSSPFLVQQWTWPKQHSRWAGRETLRLDMMQATISKYHNADFIIFNTAHWWTHAKTKEGKNYFQEGDVVYKKLKVEEAYTKALQTWAKWVDKNVNKKKTKVFFAGYSSTHFRGGQWNSGGNCDGETEPITNDKFLAPYPKMMQTLESVMSKMRTPAVYLNISKMTGYRKDGHPSKFRQPGSEVRAGMRQDCSHWCLPGVPDTWNQLLFASLLHSSNGSTRAH
ncbi:hypothetical protein Cgig2_029193 [Carnegiea gigantea]|uniref:Trichome birefringence-like C-terminal domain-containing protein n=1 Tax=Carnegiea gigantea TaxID=171969 RepID=A0A9Q1KLH1_9CARY|nr:hypothetical protein Cgig2_029193 [Carnegiea gigantea]